MQQTCGSPGWREIEGLTVGVTIRSSIAPRRIELGVALGCVGTSRQVEA